MDNDGPLYKHTKARGLTMTTRRYSAKSMDDLLLAIWLDRNQDFPVSFAESLIETMREEKQGILYILQSMDVYATMWRSEQ